MRRPYLAGLVWLATAAVAWAGEIAGPDTIEAGHPAWYHVSGASSSASVIWDFDDRPGVVLEYGTEHLQPGWALLWSKPPGTVVLKLIVVDWDARQVEQLKKTVTVTGEGPQPDPGPGPEPPFPDWPDKLSQAVIVHQGANTGTMPVDQGLVLVSRKVRERFPPGGFRLIDFEEVGPDDKPVPMYAPYVRRARELGIVPLLLLFDGNRLVYEGALPEDVPAMLKLIEEGPE